MVKSLGEEAYEAARNQTTQKLSPMKEAFIALADEDTSSGENQGLPPNSDSPGPTSSNQ